MICFAVLVVGTAIRAIGGCDPVVEPDVVSGTNGKDSAAVLERIRKMLGEGLETQVEPFPQNATEFAQILDQLRELEPDDLEGRLVIGGFTEYPYGPEKMRCQECIYYLVHRKWCDLPELSVPVEPDWYCRLWKI